MLYCTEWKCFEMNEVISMDCWIDEDKKELG